MREHVRMCRLHGGGGMAIGCIGACEEGAVVVEAVGEHG